MILCAIIGYVMIVFVNILYGMILCLCDDPAYGDPGWSYVLFNYAVWFCV